MPHFTVAPVAEVVPKRKVRGPSQRSQTQQQYRDALEGALHVGHALVIELEPTDKPLTIRNRVRRAVTALGAEDVRIRRRGTRILAYREPGEAAS